MTKESAQQTKIKIIPVFVLILISSVSFGQSWFPINAQWHYSAVKFDTVNQGYYNSFITIDVVSDTVVFGEPSKIIERPAGGCDLLPTRIIVREDSGVVMFLNSSMTTFDTLVDMNKNIGEYWTIHPDNTISSDSIIVSVIGKGEKIINGDTLAALKVTIESPSWGWSGTDTILEKIGFYPGYFFFQFLMCDPWTGNLRCYFDESIGLFETGIVDHCEQESGVGVPEDSIGLKIFPNPATDYLFLYSDIRDEFDVIIYNISGEVVAKEICTDSDCCIDISALANGIYFLSVSGCNSGRIQFLKE